MGGFVVRVERDGFTILGDGFVELSLCVERVPEVAVGERVVRVKIPCGRGVRGSLGVRRLARARLTRSRNKLRNPASPLWILSPRQ